MDESQAQALYDEVALWTPQLLISPPLLLKEYYQDRVAGIELLVEQIGMGSNVGVLVKLVEAVFDPESPISSVTRPPVQPELRKQWSEYRAREELLLVQGLAGGNLTKHAARLFATFAKVGHDKPLALIRAWYVCLLPLPPPAVSHSEGIHLANKYYQPFLPPAEDGDNVEEEWLVETLVCLRDALASTTLGRLTSTARRVLREYMELLAGTRLDSVLYSQDFCELAALGFGRTEPFACDAFWAGQYSHLLAWYHRNPSALEGFVASAGFTKRQPRTTTVTLTSRDLKHASAAELCDARTVVVQAHARLLDAAPSRRPLGIEEQTMGGTVLRILLAAASGENGEQQQHVREWELLVCEALDCLNTLCERNAHCRELVVRCTRRDHYQANYLLQVLLELGAVGGLVTEFAVQLVKTVLERADDDGEGDSAFLRDGAKFAIRLRALELVPLLGKVGDSYVFEQLVELCLDSELAAAARPLLHLLKTKPIPETSSQRFVLALFRDVFDANVQFVLLAVLGWGKSESPLLGVLGPDFLPQTARNLVECMGDGEPSVFDLLLVLQRTEPELVRMFIHSQPDFTSVLLGVTLENENEAVLQPACELAHEVLKKFALEVDPEYFTGLLGIYRALELGQHLRLKTQLVRLLAIGQSAGCQLVQALADSFPVAGAFGGEHDGSFFQAWSDLLYAQQQQQVVGGVDLARVWETLCQLAVGGGGELLPAFMAQVLECVGADCMSAQTLQDLATAVDASGAEAVANVFILAANKVLLARGDGSGEENVQRVRCLLMPVACRMLLQNQSKALLIDCLGSRDAKHPLLGECFLYLFRHCADDELALRGLLCSASTHAELLLSLHIVPKLLCVSPDKHVAIKFAIMCELLERAKGNRELAVCGFFDTYSAVMLAQLSKFHGQGSALTISALHLTRLVVRLMRLLGEYRLLLDQHLQACFGLIADLALGDEAHVARGGAGMMEEFADHYKCEEQRKTKLAVVSQLVLRAVPETTQERAWAKQFIKTRRSSSTGGMSNASSTTFEDVGFPQSPFRRSGSNLFGAFNEPTTDAPGTAIVAAAPKKEDTKHRVTPFHVKVEAHMETLLAELFLVFFPFLKQRMLVFGLDESVRPTVFTLLSLLRWLANSSYSPSKSRLAGLVSISLLLALERGGTQLGGFVTRLAASDKDRPALSRAVVEKHVVDKLILRIVKRLPSNSGQDRALLQQAGEGILKLF